MLGLLNRGEVFSAARFGFFELSVMRNFHFGRKKNYEKILTQLKNCAGVFPAEHRVGEEFLRLNIACPETLLRDGLNRLKQGIEDYKAK